MEEPNITQRLEAEVKFLNDKIKGQAKKIERLEEAAFKNGSLPLDKKHISPG